MREAHLRTPQHTTAHHSTQQRTTAHHSKRGRNNVSRSGICRPGRLLQHRLCQESDCQGVKEGLDLDRRVGASNLFAPLHAYTLSLADTLALTLFTFTFTFTRTVWWSSFSLSSRQPTSHLPPPIPRPLPVPAPPTSATSPHPVRQFGTRPSPQTSGSKRPEHTCSTCIYAICSRACRNRKVAAVGIGQRGW